MHIIHIDYIIIIIFINCKWVGTRWQWLFYIYTEFIYLYARILACNYYVFFVVMHSPAVSTDTRINTQYPLFIRAISSAITSFSQTVTVSLQTHVRPFFIQCFDKAVVLQRRTGDTSSEQRGKGTTVPAGVTNTVPLIDTDSQDEQKVTLEISIADF
jgi:hypothetical protein